MGDILKAALATEENEDTYVLICGNTNGMGRDVYDAMITADLASKERLDEMKVKDRYIMELWGE